MKRSKRHRVKQEIPETSTSRVVNQKEHDLAYYIHDRVELMHQVFSVLKPKELKAMAPECVRHISINDLQELCMEELLGISSKRLCAILDGAGPPSDTESSSESEQLETISLDSISSDEEILSQISAKKSKKHKHRSKSKPKKRKSKDKGDEDKDQADRSRRAGLTVLELLELQARARAIRAQLQQEQANAVSAGGPSESMADSSSDDEVEIKEEAAEVVEISSEDEKPNIEKLEEKIQSASKDKTDTASNTKTITKKVNDLIITVPKTNTSRKIKLKRNTGNNVPATVSTPENDFNSSSNVVRVEETNTINPRRQRSEISTQIDSVKSSRPAKSTETLLHPNKKNEAIKTTLVNTKDKNKCKERKKKRKRDKQKDKDGSDHDEIMLQLSDTEKMDLLEDLEGKKSVMCTDTEDSSIDSSNDDSTKEVDSDDRMFDDRIRQTGHSSTLNTGLDNIENHKEPVSINENIIKDNQSNKIQSYEKKVTENVTDIVEKRIVEENKAENNKSTNEEIDKSATSQEYTDKQNLQLNDEYYNINVAKLNEHKNCFLNDSVVDTSCIHEVTLGTAQIDKTVITEQSTQNKRAEQNQNTENCEGSLLEVGQVIDRERNIIEVSKIINIDNKLLEDADNFNNLLSNSATILKDEESNIENTEGNVVTVNKDQSKEKSEGELSDRDSSEVEASDLKPDVVCISDEEENKVKKKKKDKKHKKEKKSKKKKDFRESTDQNFYSQINEDVPNKSTISNSVKSHNVDCSHDNPFTTMPETGSNELRDAEILESKYLKSEVIRTDINIEDDVYEILELSDDSSCYEIEEITISKEPTAEEIEALSAKVDELEKDSANERKLQENEDYGNLVNVSWKDRYLESSKVKKVLTTANIMNAMRKKNLQLKKKLQNSKNKNEVEDNKIESNKVPTTAFEDGSVEQYNTLETSTKYVNPVKEVIENTNNVNEIEKDSDITISDDKNKTKDSVTKEMKKEAKQLLKMYKMLLKYNDMSKQKDPSKKKKKKSKDKNKDKNIAS